MVIKGGARGGAADLAKHLQRTDTNERAELVEVRGVAAEDLRGALGEMEAVGYGTRSKRPLYHASINTDPGEQMTEAQWTRAIDALEKNMGLEGQPRVVVEHEKEGREHRHVVWSRIDLEHMTAISDSHNFRRHEEVARMLEQEFGHKHVQGAHIGREGQDGERVPRPERTPSHAEMQQAERTGLTPKEAKEQITELWQRTDSGQAFAAALENEGWALARGDKRDFVVIDQHGEAHSLARRIDGANAKNVRERMADVDATKLPSVEEARAQQIARQEERGSTATPRIPAEAPTPEASRTPLVPAPTPQSVPRVPMEPAAEAAIKLPTRAGTGIVGGIRKALDAVDRGITSFFVREPPKSPEQQREEAVETAKVRIERAEVKAEVKQESERARVVRELMTRTETDRVALDEADREAARKRDYGGRTRE